jgi:hypothetical protein
MKLTTRRNGSGRSRAAVKAAMPPELEPAMARSSGLFDRLNFLG